MIDYVKQLFEYSINYKVLQFAIFKTGIPVASKMMPTMERKNADMYMVTGYELAHRMGKPEYMSVSSLRKYLNHDSSKYKFWLEKIHQGLVLLKLTTEERKEAASCGHYLYFSNFYEGKIFK